jgi:DNA-binding transcriptional LysR family regulator
LGEEGVVAIAEEEHFERAAGRLGIAQPPLSQGLQRLERSLGVILVERSPRGVRLNAAGRDLLPRARALLHDAEDLRRVAATYGAAAASLRVGTVPQLSARVATAVATACQSEVGGVVELATASTTELVDLVTAGQLDLAVVIHPAARCGAQPSCTSRVSTPSRSRCSPTPREPTPPCPVPTPRSGRLRGLRSPTCVPADCETEEQVPAGG